MAEDSVSVVILLSNGNIPKDIFKSSVDEYFGPQVDDFKESSLSVCVLSEKTGLIPSKSNTATFVKSQWFYLTNFAPDKIFEFKLVICDNNSWDIIRSEDSEENRLIQTFSIPTDKAIVVHLEWNKPHTVSEESLMELLSMDESLIKSHYENLETAETFKNLETINEDHNDEESLLDSLQEERDENDEDNKINSDTDDSLEPGKEVDAHKPASRASLKNDDDKMIEENEQNTNDILKSENTIDINEDKEPEKEVDNQKEDNGTNLHVDDKNIVDSSEPEKEDDEQRELLDDSVDDNNQIKVNKNDQNICDFSEPEKDMDSQKEDDPRKHDTDIDLDENDQKTVNSLEPEKEVDKQKEKLDNSVEDNNHIDLDAKDQNTVDSSNSDKKECEENEPFDDHLKNDKDINLEVNDQNTGDSSELEKEAHRQKEPSDISPENDKDANFDENDQNTVHPLEPEKEVDNMESLDISKENESNQNNQDTIGSLEAEKEGDIHEVELTPSPVNEKDQDTKDSIKPREEIKIPTEKVDISLPCEYGNNPQDTENSDVNKSKSVEKNVDIDNVFQLNKGNKEHHDGVSHNDELKNDNTINTKKGQQWGKVPNRKTILITKIQSILGIKSELNNIKQKNKEHVDEAQSANNSQIRLADDDNLKESNPSSDDVIINQSGKFHEKVSFISFAEETSPLITSEKEEFANEAIHSNKIENHDKDNQNIKESEVCHYDDNISNLPVNPIEESLQPSEDKHDNTDIIEDDGTMINEAELTDNSLIPIQPIEEFIRNDKEEDMRSGNLTSMNEDIIENSLRYASLLENTIEETLQPSEDNHDNTNIIEEDKSMIKEAELTDNSSIGNQPSEEFILNDKEEDLRSENPTNMNKDIVENAKVIKETTPQPISCILVSPNDETKEIKNLESPEFSMAIENIQEEFDKLITIHSEVYPNNNPMLICHSTNSEDKNNSKDNEILPIIEINTNTSISNVEEIKDEKDSDKHQINADIYMNPKNPNPKVETIGNPKINKTKEKELPSNNVIQVECETNKPVKEENIIQSTKHNDLSEIPVENKQEELQPKVSDIIDKFETLKMRKESGGKVVVDKEKDKKRISDIVKLYEDINLNKEDVNVKPHILKKTEIPIKDDRDIFTPNTDQDNKNMIPINKEIKITYETHYSQNAAPMPSEVVERDISKEGPKELRDNDDYKYPDSVTPTKVEQGLSQLAKYDVLFIDDDVFYKENWYKESNNRWTTLERSKIVNNENSLTPASEVPLKNTPKASLETLNENEIEKIKVSIESTEPTRKKKGLLNLCGCVGGRKRS